MNFDTVLLNEKGEVNPISKHGQIFKFQPT